MITETEILKEMLKTCAEAGFKPTANASKIARAKSMLCKDDWHRCPCDRENEARFCISELCKSDIEKDGICHCRCYERNVK